MSLATNPHARFEVVLESDKYLPEDSRPVLIYRYLTGIEQKELSRKWASLDKIKDGEKSLDVTFETATIGLIDWRNVTDRQGEPIEFAADRLQEIMGMAEGHELIAKVFSQRPNVEDKKKLDSPLPSSTGQSAEAAPALQNARTSQQQPSPSESDVPDVTAQDASNAKRAAESI